MFRSSTRVTLGGALLAGTLLTGGAAHADEPAPNVRVSLLSIVAYELEESGHDEIYVIAQKDKTVKRVFPYNDDDLSVARFDCVHVAGDACPEGTNTRSVNSGSATFPADGRLLMVALMEDDHIGDDVLINVPLWPKPISETQYQPHEANINGYHYRFVFRLEPTYA
ncbi:hypothetical protein ACIBCT_02510 [Streptosporangium sp. NPDC050855]|uniref:hypothetical protein n=1 Tax=Streptosporangium sp. NPDC050855 TaxID=3366194 RepID=UPI0037936C18